MINVPWGFKVDRQKFSLKFGMAKTWLGFRSRTKSIGARFLFINSMARLHHRITLVVVGKGLMFLSVVSQNLYMFLLGKLLRSHVSL